MYLILFEYYIFVLQMTQRISKERRTLPKEEFARILIEKLEVVKREREQQVRTIKVVIITSSNQRCMLLSKCCELWCSCTYRRRLCTQMLQIRDVFLGQMMCCSELVETSCYLFRKNNCTRKQHTLKAVVKVSRNIELYSCQTTHLKSKPLTT